MDYLINIANNLYLFSFLVRDILWLRILIVIAERSAPTDVVAIEETHYMSWPKDKLKAFLKDKAELQSALQLTLGFDLSQRLEASYLR